ncbi:MAG: AMP-binding protein, partial [Calditrichota bacterium]
MGYQSLGKMFREICQKYPERTGFMYKDGGQYQSITFAEANQQVVQIAAALLSLGTEKSDKVLLLSENRTEWAFSDYAILSLGAITVPIYPTLLSSHIEFI